MEPRVSFITLAVPDLEAAHDFYVDGLGWPPAMYVPGDVLMIQVGDKLRFGRWTAPYETVRRYLVTGQIDAGRNRQLAHDLIVTAMTQLRRWGPDGEILGDQPEWAAARTAVSELMERYAAGRR